MSLIPPARREDICRNRLIDWADCSADRAAYSPSSDMVQGAEDDVTEHSCGGKALKYSESSAKEWIERWHNKHSSPGLRVSSANDSLLHASRRRMLDVCCHTGAYDGHRNCQSTSERQTYAYCVEVKD